MEKNIKIYTHEKINRQLCGEPVKTAENYSLVELKTTAEMAADETGLLHGGFIFGLADYAAMIAVNDPNVVLAKADVSFLKPSVSGDILTAEAKLISEDGRKKAMEVNVISGGNIVFKGNFLCFIPDKHVLSE